MSGIPMAARKKFGGRGIFLRKMSTHSAQLKKSCDKVGLCHRAFRRHQLCFMHIGKTADKSVQHALFDAMWDAAIFHESLEDFDTVSKRLGEFALSLHPEKTRLIEFGRFAAERRKQRGLGKPETFNSTSSELMDTCSRLEEPRGVGWKDVNVRPPIAQEAGPARRLGGNGISTLSTGAPHCARGRLKILSPPTSAVFSLGFTYVRGDEIDS
jgi:hypothetical protein